jgi:hypothetical protein
VKVTGQSVNMMETFLLDIRNLRSRDPLPVLRGSGEAALKGPKGRPES